MQIVPDSYGVLLREFNQCHSKQDGKFCSGGSDEFGMFDTFGGAVDPGANWKRFDQIHPDTTVALYHATSRKNAIQILKLGYNATRGYTDSSKDHVHLGGRTGLGTYIGQRGGADAVLVVFTMKKSDIEPDAGSDWKSHARLYKRDVVQFHGKSIIQHPTATATFAAINQVRVRKDRATPIGFIDLRTDRFHKR